MSTIRTYLSNLRASAGERPERETRHNLIFKGLIQQMDKELCVYIEVVLRGASMCAQYSFLMPCLQKPFTMSGVHLFIGGLGCGPLKTRIADV